MKYKNKIFFINETESIFGKLITLFNRIKFGSSDVTHTGIVADETKDQVLIFESVPKGFVSSWYDKSWLVEAEKRGTVKFKETKKRLTKVLDTCKKYEGTPYGYINLVFHGINLVLSLLFLNKFKYSDGIVAGHCSEMVSRVIYDSSNKSIDFEKDYDKSFDQITPQEIYMSSQMK
jgi:hypothetical protein